MACKKRDTGAARASSHYNLPYATQAWSRVNAPAPSVKLRLARRGVATARSLDAVCNRRFSISPCSYRPRYSAFSRALRPAEKVQLHHGDVAMLVELEIGDFKHGRAFAGTRARAGQLNNDLLGV